MTSAYTSACAHGGLFRLTRRLSLVVLAGWLSLGSEFAAAPAPSAAPLSPAESHRRIRVAPGFSVELTAAEPLVLDPVAFDWDERGRLWVAEMADYPVGMDGKGKPGGRVRVLEDLDGDGRYDRATLFAEGLSFPTGILTWRSGCIVTAAPDIVFLPDEDGDGRADRARILFTGFNAGNQQLRINGLRWGLDGWVYCANGGHHVNYGKDVSITSVLTGEKFALGARDFRFEPDTGKLDPLSGPAQFGRARDAWGHWFGTQNSFPLWHYALEDRYLRRNPHVAPPNPKALLTESNPRVFPALPPEKRYHNFTQAGRFTSACGLTFAADPRLFEDAELHAFVCEPFHNLVQHLVVEPAGSSYSARRDDQEKIDFIASEDRWFRPVMVRTGPDGALWIADMYRYMIEHPQFLPAEGQRELMPHYRAGDDRGRMYRVYRGNRTPGGVPRQDQMRAAELVAELTSSNGWRRDKAQMMLQWRADRTVVPALVALAGDEAQPIGRVHALNLLDRWGDLSTDALLSALRAPEPGVREQALQLAERSTEIRIIEAAVRLVDDPDPKVRLQLACSLGQWPQRIAGEALAKLATKDRDESRFRGAIISSLQPHVGAVAAVVREGDDDLADATLETAIGDGQHDVVLTFVEQPILQAKLADDASMQRVRSVLTLLRGRGTSVDALAGQRPRDARWSAVVAAKNALLEQARAAMALASPERQAVLATLLLGDPREMGAAVEQLGRLLAPQNRLESFAEYVGALAGTGDVRVPDFLLRDFEQRTPTERAIVLDAILSREAWLPDLLDRVQSGRIPRLAIDAQRQARLVRHPSALIRRQASQVFSAANESRQKVIESFRPALALAGDPAKGRATFALACSACHQLEGVGLPLGPDLRTVVNFSAEKLLYSILDPNADIQPGFAAYLCELRSGEQIYGAIASETGASLAFRLPDGSTRTVVRDEIKSLHSANVSLMPEGLESVLTLQSLADLIAYLKTPSG